MRAVIPLILFLLFILPQTSAEIIGEIEGTWKLSFEITNTNPYTVFVAIPDYINFSDKSLKYSTDFTELNTIGIVTTNKDTKDYYTTLNGEVGVWIPPYTTVKIYKDGSFLFLLNAPVERDKFKVVGPALMNMTCVFNEIQLKPLYRYGIRVSNYKLYVNGKIIKSYDAESMSIVIPAPLVLKDYDSFHKIIGRYNTDIWIDSYRKYVYEHKKMSSKRYSELQNSINDILVPMTDDILVPVMDDNLRNKDANLKPFDVPAMVFTTDDGEIKSLEFSYVMYK